MCDGASKQPHEKGRSALTAEAKNQSEQAVTAPLDVLEKLEIALGAATGPSPAIDKEIGGLLNAGESGRSDVAYTSSVDACIGLIRTVLPDWHWHVGHGPRGLLPYASLTKNAEDLDGHHLRVEASAPTVPLALLHALVKGVIAGRAG